MNNFKEQLSKETSCIDNIIEKYLPTKGKWRLSMIWRCAIIMVMAVMWTMNLLLNGLMVLPKKAIIQQYMHCRFAMRKDMGAFVIRNLHFRCANWRRKKE